LRDGRHVTRLLWSSRRKRRCLKLRLELFQAEQRILDAQVHADYYRARLAFCESVLKNGIEQVSDKRKEPETAVATLRSGPKLTAAQSA